MWIDFIKWRTEFKVDELYEHFEYPELVEVDKLYPKFYHKTDKVSLRRDCAKLTVQMLSLNARIRMEDQYISRFSAKST